MKRELKESFEIRVSGTDNWYEMSVPGSAMDTLVKEGVLPDPYYGENEYEVREFFRNDFDIRGHFTVSPEEFPVSTCFWSSTGSIRWRIFI